MRKPSKDTPFNVLVVADPINTFDIKKDSTYVMIQQLWQHGHTVYMCTPEDVVLATSAHVWAQRASAPWYQLSDIKNIDLHDFDIILMRKDPPYDMEYIYSTHMLEAAEQAGVKVLNAPQSLRLFSEKLSIFQFPQHIVPTIVTRHVVSVLAFVRTHEKAIIKPLDKMGGSGIFLLDHQDPNLENLVKMFCEEQRQSMMVQKFIPEIVDGDKRILIIGDTIVPYILARIPQNNVRANLVSGGRGEVRLIQAKDLKIAQDVHAWMKQNNIFFAGIDVIGDYLTEVNITSPTCMQQIGEVVDVGALWYQELLKTFTQDKNI